MSTSLLEQVKPPELFWEIRSHLLIDPGGQPLLHETMPGFEDVIPERLGAGFFYNTPGSISQLTVALSVAPNPRIGETVMTTDPTDTEGLVRALRAQRVLAGFKVLDLGCGMVPSLAIAAKSMGAEVHTADGEPLDIVYAKWVATHTAVDLTAPEAIPNIEANSGGNFDYATAQIVGNVPGHPSWVTPDEEAIRSFGEQLLKPGGYHYQPGHDLLQKI